MKNSSDPFRGELVTPQLIRAVREWGRLALSIQEKGTHTRVKSTKEDLVTEGDKILTEKIKKVIGQLFPGCQYVDEETENTHKTDVLKGGIVAIIDPIDGTMNYYEGSLEPDRAKRNAAWGISVGFAESGEVKAGVICQPQTGKIYYAEKGKGAYLHEERIYVSSTYVPHGAKLIYSPPYPKDKEAYAASETAIARIENEIPMKVTTLGSQVIDQT